MAKKYLNKFVKILLDPRISSKKKLLFIGFILLYWILPDLMPFMPLDDLIVTIIGIWTFVRSAEKEILEKKNTIDVKAKIIDDD